MRLLPKDTRDGPRFCTKFLAPHLVRWAVPGDFLPEGKRHPPEALKDVARLIDQAVDLEEWEYTTRGGYYDPSAGVHDIELADGRRLCQHIVQSGQDLSDVAQITFGGPEAGS